MRKTIRQYIRDNFLFGSASREIRDDVSLMETRILDSTGVMELVVFLEREFDVRVLDKDLVPENLDTVDRICRYLEGKGVAASQSA